MSENDEREIGQDWLTKAQVAAKLGKSLAAVVRLQKAGRLHPLVDDDGINRYEPSEVAEILISPAGGSAERKEEAAEFELSAVKAIIDLVRHPREKIDEIQFRIIERQQTRIEQLEARIEAQQREVEQARDNNAERSMALGMSQSETRIKELAMSRMIETVQRLMSGGNASGVQLTPEQLQELIRVEEFLTPEQQKAAKAAIVAHQSKTKLVQTVTQAATEACASDRDAGRNGGTS